MLARVALAVAVTAATVALAACDGGGGGPARRPVELVAAPAEVEVAPWVAAEVARAGGRDVVVYVGASWCEPCRYFHDAVAAHRLDARFPGLRLLEFDLDRDEARLTAAGYSAEMIPLFALPAADGRAAGPMMAGSIKGPGAVDEIAPRLAALLAQAPR